MTDKQRSKYDSLAAILERACEELGDLAGDVSLTDFREGSNLSHGVDALEGVLQRFLGAEVPA